ncbi:unnamed protein product, partial [Pseudo-nitzschia multistriata]
SDGTEGYIAVVFEVSCKPCDSVEEPPSSSIGHEHTRNSPLPPSELTKSVEPECFDSVLLVGRDTGNDPFCEYTSFPLIVEELDDIGSNEVRFSITNYWVSSSSEIELVYDRGDGLGRQYQSLNSLSRGTMYPFTLAAACDPTSKSATIEVHVCNNGVLHSSSRAMCGDGSVGSCSFTYKVPCSADILCDGSRRLNDRNSINIEQGFLTDEMKAAAEPCNDDDDAPYCLHDDYPCQGDEERMVYVCHYSSISGYQTFCVPEVDSDILRFNSNHHCGPCDGWNGVEQ